MTQRSTTPQPTRPADYEPILLQAEDDEGQQRMTAAIGRDDSLLVYVYGLDWTEDTEYVTDTVHLTPQGWATLVEAWALRHPQQCSRLIGKVARLNQR